MSREEDWEWIESYLEYGSVVEKKQRLTINDMRSTLKRAEAVLWMKTEGRSLWKCSFEDFLGYIDEERSTGKSPSTLSKQVSHLRGMLNYAWRSGRCERNVLDGFDLSDNGRKALEPATLNLEEARALILACPGKTSQQRRERVIVILLYGTGLRTAELCGLDLADVDRERQELFVRGKGGKERRLPLPDVVWTELLAYISDRGNRSGALFKSLIKGRRIRAAELLRLVRERASMAGISMKVTPKTLRHTFATHLMDQGVRVEYISSLMGHHSVRETGVYLHALKGRTEEAVLGIKIPGGEL